MLKVQLKGRALFENCTVSNQNVKTVKILVKSETIRSVQEERHISRYSEQKLVLCAEVVARSSKIKDNPVDNMESPASLHETETPKIKMLVLVINRLSGRCGKAGK